MRRLFRRRRARGNSVLAMPARKGSGVRVPKNVIMPALGVSQDTGRVVKWLKADGEQVGQGELLLEVETDKATVELEAPASGVLLNVTAAPGDEVPVGTVIGKIWAAEELTKDAAEFVAKTPPSASAPALSEVRGNAEHIGVPAQEESGAEGREQKASVSGPRGRVLSSPKARRLAAEKGIDLNSLEVRDSGGPVVASSLPSAAVASRPPSSEEGPESSRIWRIMAERTTDAWKSIPHFYVSRSVDAGNLIEWRKSLRDKSSGDITVTDLLVKKVGVCLRSHPYLNSEWRNGNSLRHEKINIGLAVAVDEGLVVPVIRNADGLTVTEIAAARSKLVERAQAGKLGPDDISAGTFTISNLGMYGVDFFQAIVNPPQAAILAVGRIAQQFVPVDGQPAVRSMVTLTLSCDHRLVDGARAARFLADLASSIEQAASVDA